jgi:hypothetical protein
MELQGWKQIADYLHVTDRTAQNWAPALQPLLSSHSQASRSSFTSA